MRRADTILIMIRRRAQHEEIQNAKARTAGKQDKIKDQEQQKADLV